MSEENAGGLRAAVSRAIEAGIDAAHPRTVIAEAVTVEDGVLSVGDSDYSLGFDRVVVLGGGNAAATAAAALEPLLGDTLDGGVVVTDDPVDTGIVEVIEGTHPLPSAANVAGTEQVLDCARDAGADTLALVVITGGGSALLAQPVDGLALSELREITDELLAAGASIGELNAVRKHLSASKGGQLAEALAPATTVGLLFSDVVGNREDIIASGPLTPDETTYADAVAVLERYGIEPPTAVKEILAAGERGERAETPVPGEEYVEHVDTHILADNRTALTAAAASLEADGYPVTILGDEIEGEASDVGQVHAAIAESCRAHEQPFAPPIALVSGGETTVTVDGDGVGGPNQEFALAAALELDSGVVAAVDTDGLDGASGVAGALLDANSVEDESRIREVLDTNDAHSYLAERGGVIETGRTGTNVNDLRVVLVADQ